MNPDNPLAAVDEVSNTLVVVLTGTLLVLFAASAGLAHATRHLDEEVPRPFRRYAAGMAAPVVAALGGFLAVGYSAALLLASAELLVDDAALPELVEGVTFTWGISVLLLVAVGLVLGFRTWTDRDWRTERVRRSYGLGLRVGGVRRADVAHGRAGAPDRDGERGRAGQARAARRARLLLVPRHGARGASSPSTS